jgi:hypothetical protein
MGFLDNIFNNDDNKDNKNNKKSGGGMPNPFANLGQPRTFHGQGQSLGGREQGTVLSISLPNPGPLGIRVSSLAKISFLLFCCIDIV